MPARERGPAAVVGRAAGRPSTAGGDRRGRVAGGERVVAASAPDPFTGAAAAPGGAPSAAPGEALVEVRDLAKHFPITKGILFARQVGAVKAVDGVSFDVRRGETLGLVGETGCGKSTTARLVLRLLAPTAGQGRFDGQDITHLRGAALKALRRQAQMIFQDPYSSLNPRKTIGSIIGEPFTVHGLEKDKSARKRAVQTLMETGGLNPERD